MTRLSLYCAIALLGCGPKPPTPPTGRTSAAAASTDPAPADVGADGKATVELLAAGEHIKVHARFDEAMRKAMSAADLGELWKGVLAQAGPFDGVRGLKASKVDGFDVVEVTCAFEKAKLVVRVVLDDKRRIAGLFIRPADQSDEYRVPAYAKMDAIEEIEVSVGEGDFSLPGTITCPKGAAAGACPGLVLVHGSGPNDRDESLGPNKPFRDLALGLASAGVCVLRYEKRTKQHGKLVVTKFGDALTVHEETVEDALGAADLLRKHAAVSPDRVFVLGHSLGGWAIPRIAQGSKSLRGFVILAGSTRPLEDMVLDQVSHISGIDGTISAQEKAAIDKLKAQVANVKKLGLGSKTDKRELPLGIPVAYWLDLKAHPPAKLIAGETRPLLVLQGDRDYQVTLVDFEGWKKALANKKNATFKHYAALNHLFIAGEGKSQPTEYLKPGNVAKEVVDDIAAWLLAN